MTRATIRSCRTLVLSLRIPGHHVVLAFDTCSRSSPSSICGLAKVTATGQPRRAAGSASSRVPSRARRNPICLYAARAGIDGAPKTLGSAERSQVVHRAASAVRRRWFPPIGVVAYREMNGVCPCGREFAQITWSMRGTLFMDNTMLVLAQGHSPPVLNSWVRLLFQGLWENYLTSQTAPRTRL